MKKIMKSFAGMLVIFLLGMSPYANALCGFGWISSTPPTPTCSCPSGKVAIKRMANNVCQEEKCVSVGAANHYLNQGWIYGCCAVARLDENTSADELSVFPNPVSTVLNVTGAFDANSKIEIRDAIGRTVYSNSLNQQFSVDVSGWDRGIYFVTLTTDHNVIAKKITVQ